MKNAQSTFGDRLTRVISHVGIISSLHDAMQLFRGGDNLEVFEILRGKGERIVVEGRNEPDLLAVLDREVDGGLKRKLLSLSHGQELGQLAELTSDWLFTLVQPIRGKLAC